MVTNIQTNVAVDVGGQGMGVLDQDSGGKGGDSLPVRDLDLDDIIIVYCKGCR